MRRTVVVDPINYDVENMIFEKPLAQSKQLQGATPVSYFRVHVKTRNPDGKSQGDLILRFDRSLCLRLSNNFGDHKLCALTLLWDNQEGPTLRQRKTKEVIEKIAEKAKEWFTIDNKKSIKKAGITPPASFSPLKYRTNEDGELDTSVSPMMAINLLQYPDRHDKKGAFNPACIVTKFYSEDEKDENGNQLEIDPKTLIGKRFYATFAVKVDDIFIGKDISLQFKVVEAVVKLFDDGPKRLLSDALLDDNVDEEEPEDDNLEMEEESNDNNTVDNKQLLEVSDHEDNDEPQEPEPVVVSKPKRGKK